ncbi:deoxynucleoside kinase [Clostridium sp. 'White wine YQ']|uniref:deoxynucleoside kinase n=1 Tax=Clostridium sp. 'White wine YQ' TaxID=3027474 RepID=UPI002365CBE5|nr:deoxynucleoside kinase [Clostridium sp. 'White wine YQ']MDD7796218.1 deoxynucleoside kinase [Clostridium sp. 'White wine YQ']
MKLYEKLLSNIDRNDNWNMIVIDGVVGAGKSTLMMLLEDEGYVPFKEPVLENPILEKFYYDRRRYAFALQVYFLNNRFKFIKEAGEIENSIMDRSIYGDAIFPKLLKEVGDMSTEEFEIYCNLLSNLLEHVKPPKLMIYLQISVDEAINRIRRRGRSYEQVVEREYWETLNREYEGFFNSYTISPLLKINVDKLDFENIEEDRQYIIGLIKDKLKEIEA